MGQKRFRIVENAQPEYLEKYEEFVELYNDKNITVKDIRKELGFNMAQYNLARQKALSEGLIKNRLTSNDKRLGRRKVKKKRNYKHYSHSRSSGKYNVVKRLYENGKSVTVYCGTYDTEEQAMMVVEKMSNVGWDKKYLNKIREEVFECIKN